MCVASIISALLGIISIIYYIRIVLYVKTFGDFALVWLMLGIVLLVVAYMLKKNMFATIFVNKRINIAIFCIFCILILLFLSIEGIIIYNANAVPTSEPDYVVILGARVDKKSITPSLKKRLNAGIDYLKEHDKVKVVVSGGKGSTEDITEAEAMAVYLIEHDIKEERIIKEDKSCNTFENMKYTKELIGEDASIVVISNGFHMFRATHIAKKQNFKSVEGLGAKTDRNLLVSQYTREAFGIVKDFIVGNL